MNVWYTAPVFFRSTLSYCISCKVNLFISCLGHVPEDSDSDHPDFRSQTPDVEESTFNRRGPLTIPEVPEKLPTPVDDLLESDQHDHHGFETQPRPPTPPKDISEENVKPSAFSLAHGTHTPSPSHHDQLHSILKHPSGQYGEPWFDFKTIDPRSKYCFSGWGLLIIRDF
ncbi:hypothetical protein ANCCAN_17528 [Ancylostoma caninum]|uniref:Uncharacterized protein n=1 Tax=Ancylostoma caninum TaxID=29170 RepID=A0A368G1W2_ANCCA|nr:hypothetical protein ANCCAN_17528 [Ancylostoma caninum]